MMRKLALLVATLAVVTNSGAQTPLTVDTNFRSYYTPEIMDYWTGVTPWWHTSVDNVLLRQNGDIMLMGKKLLPLHEIPWGDGRSVIISPEGTPDAYLGSFGGGGGLIEIPLTDQYFNTGVSRRFNYNSTIDPSFSMAGFAFEYRYPGSWQIFDDRSGMVAGSFRIRAGEPTDKVLIKVDQWGEWDSTFVPRQAYHPAGPTGRLLFPLRNGQYLFNGSWTHYEGRPCGTMIRINANGSQDTTFYFPSWKSDVQAFYEQADGKTILGGQFWMNAYSDTLKLVRLNTDGSMDLTFNNFTDYRTGTSIASSMVSGINVLEPLDATRFVVGGAFSLVDGQARGCIACVDTLGNLLDCWADGGLQPVSIEQNGLPRVGLGGFKRLANGDTYIYGQYKGFGDANGMHPEQVMISRIYLPGVGAGLLDHDQDATPLVVYPNPGADEVGVRWAGKTMLSLSVYDMQGRAVLSTTVSGAPITFDLSSLHPGMYTFQAFSVDGSQTTAKWVKQ